MSKLRVCKNCGHKICMGSGFSRFDWVHYLTASVICKKGVGIKETSAEPAPEDEGCAVVRNER